MNKNCGIYKIMSIKFPNRIYIGSSKNIKHRWVCHKSELATNTHANKKLQNHCNKYGIDDLKFVIIYNCDISELINMEQFYLDSQKIYFNILQKAHSIEGYRHTLETRKKLSEINKGKKWANGRAHSKENIKKFADVARNKNWSSEARDKIRKAQSIKFIDCKTNTIFNSGHEAAAFYGLKHTTFFAHMRGQITKKILCEYYKISDETVIDVLIKTKIPFEP